MSNDLSPECPTLLGARVCLAALKCCYRALPAFPSFELPFLRVTFRLDAEGSGKQMLLNYAARSEERPDIC